MQLGPDAQGLARRILDGLERGQRQPTGAQIRGAMAMLDATRSELAALATAADRAGGAS